MQQVQGYIKGLLDFFSVVVIKNERKAKEYETKDSYKKSHYFMSALNRTDSFLLYAELYTVEDFKAVGMDPSMIANALEDIKTVPDIYKDKLLVLKRDSVINDYEEINNYYRMLNGEPFYKDEPITLRDGRKVTELRDEEVDGRYRNEIENLIRKYKAPKYHYLRHLGKRRISYYIARNSENYTILYYDDSIFPNRHTKRIIELFYESLNYCVKVFYSDSFKDYELYDDFFIMSVIFMTIQKYNSEVIKFGIRHEFIELNDIKDFFDTYSVPFDANIPTKYLKRIVQNMNDLIKHKGTNKVLIDIIDLFGFENMQVFKQYLVKDINKDVYNDPIISDDPAEMYTMKFVEIPIEERNLSYAFRSSNRVFDYDDVTSTDQFWGGSDNDYLKMELLKKEFNHIATKYISITTLFNLTKVSTETSYFVNMLNELEERKMLDGFFFVNTDIKPSGSPITLFNAICALQCLICHRFGYEDNIMYTNTQIASLYGFNFDSDIDELEQIVNGSPTLKSEYEKFLAVYTIPERFSTKRAMIDFFFNNIGIKESLEYAIIKSTTYKEYRLLSDVYKYNHYSKAARGMFVKADGSSTYKRYIEYLRDSDFELASYLEDVIYKENIVDISKSLDEIINSLELYLDSHKLDNIFSGFTQLNSELIQNYIYTLINHFKSYTTQIDKFDVYYIFNDKFSNTIKLLDSYDFGNKSLDKVDYLLIDLYEYLNIDKGVQRFDDTLKQLIDELSLYRQKSYDSELITIFDKYNMDIHKLEIELLSLLEDTEEYKLKEYTSFYNIYDNLKDILINNIFINNIIITENIKNIYYNKYLYYIFIDDYINNIYKIYNNNEIINIKDNNIIYPIYNNIININFKEKNLYNNYNNITENMILLEDNNFTNTIKHLNNDLNIQETITIERN